MKHWYCFTYIGTSLCGARNATASTYVGFNRRGVTVTMIQEQKKEAGLNNDAVLIACIHLGYMSRDEFIGT